jgi:antitoxin CptB
MSDLDRIRWRCRRGMLELDLVLTAFLGRHLANLDAGQLDAFRALLERTDPELLAMVMGHAEPEAPGQRAVLELVRTDPLIPAPLPRGEGRPL